MPHCGRLHRISSSRRPPWPDEGPENGWVVSLRLPQPARVGPAASSPRADARPLRGCGALTRPARPGLPGRRRRAEEQAFPAPTKEHPGGASAPSALYGTPLVPTPPGRHGAQGRARAAKGRDRSRPQPRAAHRASTARTARTHPLPDPSTVALAWPPAGTEGRIRLSTQSPAPHLPVGR